MSEALKPCPACGNNKPFAHMRVQLGDKPSMHDNRRWAVFCGYAGKDTCRFLVDACETEEEAIAAWNRRASPSWSTEPTEEGWYLVYLYCPSNSRRFTLLGGRSPREW